MTKLAQQLKHGAGQAWESISEGWRELGTRASGAVTRLWPSAGEDTAKNAMDEKSAPEGGDEHWLAPARWAFMAADVYATRDKVIVRMESPGMKREDFEIELTSPEMLSVSGHKRYERELADSSYAIVQSAYGRFRREFRLPAPVDVERAKASYDAGVLRIELPRRSLVASHRIEVRAT
ncbi:MAG: Hsp20/alpha crystallin family protein [Paucibacter sp.]|nr:Hsp20/alpha crystallin family protein [Roseateles sp.]